jgi:hypothetical protein
VSSSSPAGIISHDVEAEHDTEFLPYTRHWLDDIAMTHAGEHLRMRDHYAEFVNNCNHSEQAIIEYILTVAYEERRGVTYVEFGFFEIEGHTYHFSYGHMRNAIAKFNRSGLILELGVIAGRKHFTVMYPPNGVKRGKLMTTDPRGVRLANNPLYRVLKDTLMNDPAIHDIHMRFTSRGLWTLMSSDLRYPTREDNKAIILSKFHEDIRSEVNVVINRNDTVTVSIACSITPYQTNVDDLMRLSTLVGGVEQKLKMNLFEVAKEHTDLGLPIVPESLSWRVTMLHLGRDGKYSYSGEKFDMTLGDATYGLFHIYAKDFDRKTKIRLEQCVTPDSSLMEVIRDKLNLGKLD